MKITHKIDEFLAELFPQYKNNTSDLEVLKLEIAKYYSYGPYKPSVSINGDLLTIDSIPDKQFSGYQILAWYYVSWSLAMPDMVGQLGLDYAREYEMAKLMPEINK